jgi:transmembrane sensor
MTKRDFQAALRVADEAMGQLEPTAELDERVLGRTRPAQPWFRSQRLVLVAALTLAASALVLWWRLSLPSEPAVPSVAHGWTVSEASDDLNLALGADGLIELQQGTCKLTRHRATLQVAAPGRLRNEQDGMRVVAGSVDVQVQKRNAEQPPVHVLVSHGVIEVVGTHFTIEQQPSSGRVVLHEGLIRFVSDSGRSVDLVPGQALAWPLTEASVASPSAAPSEAEAADEAPEASASSSASAAVPAARPPGEDVDALLRRVEVLRSRGRYREAAEELERGSASLPAETRERLSFERGSLLTYQLKDRARACAHWRVHQSRFPNGRYDNEVRGAVQHLRCGKDEMEVDP